MEKELYGKDKLKKDQIKELINNGFKKDLPLLSFNPYFPIDFYYTNRYDTNIVADYGNFETVEVGIFYNPTFYSMKVYICNCVIGCCGKDQGIFPFSINKIIELKDKYIKEMKELHNL